MEQTTLKPIKVGDHVQATIINTFYLGFIVQTKDGRYGQLRVPDMKPYTKELEIRALDDKQVAVGVTLNLWVLYIPPGLTSFRATQWTPEQQRRQEEEKTAKKLAIAQAYVGQKATVVVRYSMDWGYICEEPDSKLEGAILTRKSAYHRNWYQEHYHFPKRYTLGVGETVEVVVAEVTKVQSESKVMFMLVESH